MTVWLDLDGVLADFDARVKELCGKAPHEIHPKHMWRTLASQKNFFGTLDFMPDAKVLLEYVEKYNPKVLTGIPMGNWASAQKREWCAKNLKKYGDDVVTCFSKEKFKYCKPGDILIDDREKLKSAWESAGGIFILHTSVESTIAKLKELGL